MTTRTRTTRTLAALTMAGAILGGTAMSAAAAGPTDSYAPGVQRVSGPDRIATAIAASRSTFPTETTTIGALVISSANNYADAIGGGTLASTVAGPLLLTDPSGLRPDLVDEVRRLTNGSGTVFVLGGQNAVSEAVVQQLENLGVYVERVDGADRYETAANIALRVSIYNGSGPYAPIYLASGRNFPDGLAVAPLASYNAGVVLLTDGDAMAGATASYLETRDPQRTHTTAVGGAAAKADPRAEAVVGADRYQTAVKVSERFEGGFDPADGGVGSVGLGTGENWPDALAASATMGQLGGGPLLLTNGSDLGVAGPATDAVRAANPGAEVGLVFGGTKAVSDGVLADFASRF